MIDQDFGWPAASVFAAGPAPILWYNNNSVWPIFRGVLHAAGWIFSAPRRLGNRPRGGRGPRPWRAAELLRVRWFWGGNSGARAPDPFLPRAARGKRVTL